ncbi:MAG: hypothetical protein CL581_05215 [Alteromonadaceae bacterium]|nr:hypothetical protein [Alteromonadaceae bacterium]
MVGGPEGSTAGMRFNPRQSAEELQEDSSVGREDSEERARHEAKKRNKQEKRAKMMQGLQHMKIKIPQKSPEDEEDSPIKQQSELGQMTGQVGQSEALAGANPNAGGLGSNIMLATAPFIDDAFEMIRKKRDEPKFDDEKPKKTTTIDTALSRRRGKKGKGKKKRGEKTTESTKGRGKTRTLKPGYVRNPRAMTALRSGQAPYQTFGLMGSRRQSPTRFIRLTTSSGRSTPRAGMENPQRKLGQDLAQERRQAMPTTDDPVATPTTSVEARKVRALRGSRDSRPDKRALHKPREPGVAGGKQMSRATSLAGGSGGIGSTDAILASEEFLLKRAQKLKLGISPRDRIEYRHLIDQLNHLLRRLMRKEDKSMQGATDGSSPNSSGGLTSNPTGATETDPDDDATMWGAHAYDLYTRRGGVG